MNVTCCYSYTCNNI